MRECRVVAKKSKGMCGTESSAKSESDFERACTRDSAGRVGREC